MQQADPMAGASSGDGWRARLELRFADHQGRTVLAHKRHEGPMLVQRPFHPEGPVCHVYVLHPPGGVVGGDQLSFHAALEAGTRALITMPGATKFYRSAGPRACLGQRMQLAEGACLEWLPQDNIFFPGCDVRLDTAFELAEGARLIAWEVQCLGRPAVKEAFARGRLSAGLSVHRAGVPLLHEKLHVADGDLFRLGGHPLTATLVATPADGQVLAAVRGQLKAFDAPAGASLLGELLVVRLLGHDNWALGQCLQQLWQLIRPSVMGRVASVPRIWQT